MASNPPILQEVKHRITYDPAIFIRYLPPRNKRRYSNTHTPAFTGTLLTRVKRVEIIPQTNEGTKCGIYIQ